MLRIDKGHLRDVVHLDILIHTKGGYIGTLYIS